MFSLALFRPRTNLLLFSTAKRNEVGAMINNLQRAMVLERLTIEIEADDPDDSFLLAMALAGNADYLVTGDRRAGLLQRGHIERTRIVTPAIFWAEVL